ncbi:hypothetical protein XCCB100_0808 [Xanthomonas campestris pv. campestris]|uniref:Uncharacterized protein n=1 Tax=Xanthomonas campestris pv. campestris (strain B100) TaxID=509169 RepID=B0RNW4_XANCB|nr:hypothetical protein XCCB100_0808 [Xanthomonas campestris pv. campestris]
MLLQRSLPNVRSPLHMPSQGSCGAGARRVPTLRRKKLEVGALHRLSCGGHGFFVFDPYTTPQYPERDRACRIRHRRKSER